jgi:hypothetical protein
MAHIYNLSLLGGRSKRIVNSSPTQAKLSDPTSKTKYKTKMVGGVAQVVEQLPSMCKALGSISNT